MQAAINAAWAVGGIVQFDASEYVIGNITMPTGVPDGNIRIITLRGTTAQYVNEQYSANRKFGTRLRFSKANGSHMITIDSTGYVGTGTYRMENLSFIGPDTSSPWTNSSGDCIHVIGPTNRLFLDDVNITLFGGGYGIYLDTDMEDCLWRNVQVTYCKVGIKTWGPSFGVFNQNVWLNVGVQQSYALGVDFSGGGCVWSGGLVQSNQKSGLRITNSFGNVFDGIWFENNNWTATAGGYALVVTAMAGSTTQMQRFRSCRFGKATDKIYLDASATGSAVVETAFEGGYAASISGPGGLTTAGSILGLELNSFLPLSSINFGGGIDHVKGFQLRSYTSSSEFQNGVTAGSPGTPNLASLVAILKVLSSWTPGTLSVGAYAETNVRVTGALNGDLVVLGCTGFPNGFLMSARVNGADNVLVTLYNASGSKQIVGALMLNVAVFKLGTP